MGIVSYAQNFEDVMLYRALKGIDDGFYIDVGANHPTTDSVTKAFYENGWSGINIEPEFELFELLKRDRPRDINLNIAISSTVESIEFYVSSIRGWSTTDKQSADNLKDKDSFSQARIVKAISLDKLCEEYNIQEVHFLKIDVEGAEKDVLESFSFERVRPWICVVEATKPTTTIDVSEEWEYILLEKNYMLSYFDGLNKYYVSQEHQDIVDLFDTPVNVFDEFILASQRDAIELVSCERNKTHEWWLKYNESEAKTREAEAKADEWWLKYNESEAKTREAEAKTDEWWLKYNESEAKTREAEAKTREASFRANEALDNYNSIINSHSWKITKPLRLFVKTIKWLIVKVLTSLIYLLNANPKIRKIAINLLNYFPDSFKIRLKNIANRDMDNIQKGIQKGKYSKDIKQLSVRSQEILKEFKSEYAK